MLSKLSKYSYNLYHNISSITSTIPVVQSLNINTLRPTNSSIKFDNTIITYKHKNFIDLTLALFILKICNYPIIVNNSEWLIKLSRKYIGDKITLYILQYTIFKHFCAGIDEASTSKIIEKLQKLGVGSILDYAAEADISSINNNLIENEENACDMNTDFILHSIDTAHKSISKQDHFAAMKVTAIARTSLLEKYSSVQDSIKKLFKIFDLNNDGKITKAEFDQVCDKMNSDIKNLFSIIDTKNVGYIDISAWETYFDLHPWYFNYFCIFFILVLWVLIHFLEFHSKIHQLHCLFHLMLKSIVIWRLLNLDLKS